MENDWFDSKSLLLFSWGEWNAYVYRKLILQNFEDLLLSTSLLPLTERAPEQTVKINNQNVYVFFKTCTSSSKLGKMRPKAIVAWPKPKKRDEGRSFSSSSARLCLGELLLKKRKKGIKKRNETMPQIPKPAWKIP